MTEPQWIEGASEWAEEQARQATRADVARQAREHYRKISVEAQHWNSTIPAALHAWEREPKLVDALQMAFLSFAIYTDPPLAEERESMSNLLADALGEAMGETAFARWVADVTDDFEPRDEIP